MMYLKISKLFLFLWRYAKSEIGANYLISGSVRSRFIGIIFCMAVNVAFGQDGITFIDNDFQAALDQSTKENKLIFVDGYATWCAPCQLMDEEVFTTESVSEYFNTNFVNLKMDLEKGIGPILAARYNAQILPSYFVLTADETLVYGFSGFQQISDLLEHAEQSLSPQRLIKAWQARFKEGDRKPTFLIALIGALYMNGDDAYRGLIGEFLATQQDWMSESNMQFIFKYLEKVDTVLFEHVTGNYKAYETLVGTTQLEQTMRFLVHNEMQNRSHSEAEMKALYVKAFPRDGRQMILNQNIERHKSNDHLDSMVLEIDQFLAEGHHLSVDSSFTYVRYLITQEATTAQLLISSSWVEDELASRSAPDIILYSRILARTDRAKLGLKLLKQSARKARKSNKNKDLVLYKSEIQKIRR